MSWDEIMSSLAKKRKREEEMAGEKADLATENGLLKAEINKLNLENRSLEESEANEKVKVKELEGRKKDLLAVISHITDQKKKVEVNKGETSGLRKEKEAEESVEEGKVIIPHKELMEYKKAVEEVKKYKQVLEELQMLVECPVCMTTPKEGPMPCCPAGHLTCAPCLEAIRKGKKKCPSCRGSLGKGKSLLSSAIIKTIGVKDSKEEQSSPQPGPGGSQMPGSSALSSPAPESKVLKAIKGRVLTPGKQHPKVGKGSPVSAKKKVSVGNPLGAAARFEGSCPLCGKKFLDAMLLETHASGCNGDGEQETGASTAGGWAGRVAKESSDDSD